MAIPGSALLLAVLVFAPAAWADPPHVTTATAELRRHLDEVVALTRSPSYASLDAGERRTAVRKITDRLFNWSEVAKRALGPHWRERTVAERRRFAGWFASMAERATAGPVERLRAGQVPSDAIRYLGETTNGGETVVRTVIAYPRELPVDFVMTRRARQWEVCDVRVDGVSAAENYRAQFQRVIGSGSFPTLVERMSTARAAP